MTESRAPASGYRPDIDGLRAIALLSVVVYHIDATLIPGGFTGVDMFFVISGFLISQHIIGDIERGTFSMAEFYRRRVKRLALPLLLVLAVTMAVAYWLLLPADFSRAADSALFSLASLANVYFWKFGGSGYFGLDRDTMPLLHLWSLGIEEQFYMGWPLLLALAYRRSRAQLFVIASVIVAAASFAFGELWFATHDSFVYYMLPSRVGELLMGRETALRRRLDGHGYHGRRAAGGLTHRIERAAGLSRSSRPHPNCWRVVSLARRSGAGKCGQSHALVATRHVDRSHLVFGLPLALAIARVPALPACAHWPWRGDTRPRADTGACMGHVRSRGDTGAEDEGTSVACAGCAVSGPRGYSGGDPRGRPSGARG
jgi:Acyltransferase family